VGFDRLIRLDWVDVAMRIRAGAANQDELDAVLDEAGLAKETKRKTGIVLNRLWIEPHPALKDFADRGVELRAEFPKAPAVVFSWGMAISAYPFFGYVAENVGRLSALHGDCTTAEIHRRMRERYGDRETILRATNRVIQSQVDWGVIRHGSEGKQVLRQRPMRLDANDVAAWLVEAALRYVGRAVPVAALMSTPVLFPFVAPEPLGFLLSSVSFLEIQDQGGGNQYVSVRAGA